MSVSHPSPDLLLALDEGVLPEALATEVTAHLATCRVCARLKEDLRECAEPTLAEETRLRQRLFARPSKAWRAYGAWGALAASLAAGYLLWPAAKPVVAPPAPVQVARVESPAAAFRLGLEPVPLKLPLTSALVLRGQENKSPAVFLRELGEALVPYRAHRFAEAAGVLRALGQRYPKAVEPVFYEGVARLLAGEASAALPLLETARQIGGEALADEIPWYLAIAYERTAQWEKALALLRPLCGGEGPHAAQACRAIAP